MQYKLELRSIIALPSYVVSEYLILHSSEVRIFRLMNYTIIINNLNPLTFTYEDDASQSQSRYAWVYHKSFGDLLNQGILDNMWQLCKHFPHAKNLIAQINSQKNFTHLSEDYLLRSRVAELDSQYKERLIELLRFQLTSYPKNLITAIVDQSTAELIYSRKMQAVPKVPWQMLVDLNEFDVDPDRY